MDSLSAAAQDVITRGMPLTTAASKHGVPPTERFGGRVRGRGAGRRRLLPGGQPENHRREDSVVAGPGRKIGEGMKFQRTRRICGYLVGTIDRWNNAKRKEEADRVKHGLGGGNAKC